MEKRPFPCWQFTSLGRAPQRELDSLPLLILPQVGGCRASFLHGTTAKAAWAGEESHPCPPPHLPTPQLAAGHELPSLDLAVVGQVPQNPPQPPIPSLFLSSLPL